MYLIESPFTDAPLNLALEQHLFDSARPGDECFMLWRNKRAVVVGKYQNTAEEVNAGYAAEQGIQVVRRMTGGGAVYHDLGNVNYTYIADMESAASLDIPKYCRPILDTLRDMGIDAVFGGRNDLLVEGKKFSGNAQFAAGGKLLHHGTILFDSDLDAVARVLNAGSDAISSKSTKSVRSRVVNICGYAPEAMSTEAFLAKLKGRVCAALNAPERELRRDELEAAKRLARERYAAWEWNYGRSPDYSVRKVRRLENVGTLRVGMEIAAGVIAACSLRGDFFGSGDIGDLEKRLTGVRVKREDVLDKLTGFPVETYVHNLSALALAELIVQ